MNEEMKRAYHRILSDKNGSDNPEVVAREKLQEEYSRKQRLAMWIMWAFLVFEGLMMVAFIMAFVATSNTKVLIALAALFITSFETTVLMKLWYWVVQTRLLLVREVKEMRLDLVELAGRHAPGDVPPHDAAPVR